MTKHVFIFLKEQDYEEAVKRKGFKTWREVILGLEPREGKNDKTN